MNTTSLVDRAKFSKFKVKQSTVSQPTKVKCMEFVSKLLQLLFGTIESGVTSYASGNIFIYEMK